VVITPAEKTCRLAEEKGTGIEIERKTHKI